MPSCLKEAALRNPSRLFVHLSVYKSSSNSFDAKLMLWWPVSQVTDVADWE